MIRALATSVLWILGGAALSAMLFWAFLNTPESTIYTLGLSAVVAIGLYVSLAATICGTIVGWQGDWQRPMLRRTLASLGALAPAVVFVAAMWWIFGRSLSWMDAHSGEISAWFIATLNWPTVQPLLTGIRVVVEWLRWVVVPFAALIWMGDALAGGWRTRLAYDGFGPGGPQARLILATAVALATLWAPVTYGLYWMPRGLPPTWIEPAVAMIKFVVMTLVAALGFSLIVRLAARRGPAPAPELSAPRPIGGHPQSAA